MTTTRQRQPPATPGTGGSRPKTSRTRRSASPASLPTPSAKWPRPAVGSSPTTTTSSPARAAYAARGSGGLAGFDIAIPRDGGLKELLADAGRRPGRFDRVIVESISRLSRNSSVAFRVEDELRQAGVRLCAADEPLEESFGTIVLRHVNIGIARGYHHELMVKSRQGQETSTRQGWHTGGVALFGYRFVTHDHPNPHKASRGHQQAHLGVGPRAGAGGAGHLRLVPGRRHRAPPDPRPPQRRARPLPATGPGRPDDGTWRVEPVQRLGGAPQPQVHRLPGLEPPGTEEGPQPDQPARAVDLVREPAHPAIVSREEYDAVQARARANERSRQAVPATARACPTAQTELPLPRASSLRHLRAAHVGQPPPPLHLLLLPALAPTLEGHPGRPPAARVSERATAQRRAVPLPCHRALQS